MCLLEYSRVGERTKIRKLEPPPNGTDWYYIRTVFRPSLYVDICSKGTDGYDRPTLQEKSDADSQKFCFKKLRTGYVIENKLGYQFDVKLGDYANLAAVIATGTPSSVAFSDIQDNKVFVLEKVEKRIYSYMGYTSDFRNVASVMDARQKRVSYAYDSDNRLLTKMTDSNNHSTQYHYEASTDRLTGVSATASGQTRDVSYTYDEGDRIKSIKHGGTTYAFEYDGFGNQTMVKAGDKTLESYRYAPNNGPLKTVTYGNGDTQEILYDKEARIKSRRWNGQSTDAVRYEYDAYGSLEKETDLVNGRIDKDQYDMTGRLVQSTTLEKNTGASGEPTVANTHTVQSLEIGYDSYNRVNRLVQRLEGSKTKTGLVYGDASKTQRPGLAYGITVDGTQRQSLSYDAMGRCTKEEVTLPGGQKRENRFIYGTIDHLTDTDGLLSSMSNGADSWEYTYDAAGNITKIVCGEKSITYQYDELNQMIRENNGVLGTTVLYTYDAGGNMTSRKTYAYTEGTPQTLQKNETLSYRTDGWKDQLVSWNGYRYVYDAGGNPTLLRGVPLTWGEGRRLKRVSLSWGTVDFAYDSDGKRVRKTSGGNTTTYYYNGNVLSGLVRKASKDAGTTGTGTTVQFVYDTQGKPFMLRLNGKTDYFYLYNGLGDITGLVDSSNQVVVRYQYNSWGKVTSTQDTSGVSLATLNPFCYRKYVYDPETGLYCLGSRYYDPEVGRFVNADDTDVIFAKPQELYNKNLYAYCDNNPVVRRDLQGYFWETLFDIVSLGTSVVEVCVNPGDPWNWAGLIGDAIDLIPFVTGVGEATRAVKTANKVADKTTAVIKIQKAVDFTPESAKIVKSLDRSKGYTRSSLRAGTYIHNGYKATTAFIKEEKEVRLLSKLRPDYVDKTRKIIYELKPMNKRNVKKGIKQLMRYREELGDEFEMILELY